MKNWWLIFRAALAWMTDSRVSGHSWSQKSIVRLLGPTLCLLAAAGITCQSGPPRSCHFKCDQYRFLTNRMPLNISPSPSQHLSPRTGDERFDQYLTVGSNTSAEATTTTKSEEELNALQFAEDNNKLSGRSKARKQKWNVFLSEVIRQYKLFPLSSYRHHGILLTFYGNTLREKGG